MRKILLILILLTGCGQVDVIPDIHLPDFYSTNEENKQLRDWIVKYATDHMDPNWLRITWTIRRDIDEAQIMCNPDKELFFLVIIPSSKLNEEYVDDSFEQCLQDGNRGAPVEKKEVPGVPHILEDNGLDAY